MVVEATSIAWGNYEWSAGGCAVHWEDDATNTSNYLEAARRQHQLLFAGEHCSKYPAWLQGSIESALEAVYDIVSDKRRNDISPASNSVIHQEDSYILQAA